MNDYAERASPPLTRWCSAQPWDVNSSESCAWKFRFVSSNDLPEGRPEGLKSQAHSEQPHPRNFPPRPIPICGTHFPCSYEAYCPHSEVEAPAGLVSNGDMEEIRAGTRPRSGSPSIIFVGRGFVPFTVAQLKRFEGLLRNRNSWDAWLTGNRKRRSLSKCYAA